MSTCHLQPARTDFMFRSWLILCSVPSALLVSKIVNYCKILVLSTACCMYVCACVYVWFSFKNKVANQLSLMLFLLPSQSELHKAYWGIKQWHPTYKRLLLKRPRLYDSSKATPTNETALYCRVTVDCHGIHSERWLVFLYDDVGEWEGCVCVHAYMWVCFSVCVSACVHVSLFQSVCVCMWVCFSVCVCVCVHVSLF